ncbi:MAG TPA: DoxX family protein, partial [Pirellulaceae bacterium]|nr:DoxX family protein [Pirellulaceae bacterium]
PARSEVPSLRGQSEKIETKLKADRGPWLAELDKLAKDLERDMNQLVPTPEQRASRKPLVIGKPGRRFMDSEAVDGFIPYFDLTIGILLIVGFGARWVSLVAAAFLASVVLSQWPGSYGAMPTYYQAVEMFALIWLAAADAGKFAGIDGIVGPLLARCCKPKTVTVTA